MEPFGLIGLEWVMAEGCPAGKLGGFSEVELSMNQYKDGRGNGGGELIST
jgi:hypothetical protein